MDTLMQQMVEWAAPKAEIQALLLVGSRARELEFPADEWADHDFEMFVTALPVDLSSRAWLEPFGEVWVYHYMEFDDGTPHPLAVLKGGVKIDFGFHRLAELETLVREQRLHESQSRGYKILLDKQHLAEKLPPPALPAFSPPDPAAVLDTCQMFWFGAIYVAKQIRRRNLWVVKFRDGSMKLELLKMLEWHAQTAWHDGHFLTHWAGADVVRDLDHTFAHFDPAESWKALFATLELFNRVARAVAQRYHIEYPAALEAEISAYLRTLSTNPTSHKLLVFGSKRCWISIPLFVCYAMRLKQVQQYVQGISCGVNCTLGLDRITVP